MRKWLIFMGMCLVLSGCGRVETFEKGFHRWDWVWTAAGEGGDAVGRAAVLDDGVYHYCVSVMAEAGEAGALETQWSALMGSIEVV